MPRVSRSHDTLGVSNKMLTLCSATKLHCFRNQVGHEDWVHSVAWQPPLTRSDGSAVEQPLCVLSASMDRTMMLWRPDPGVGVLTTSLAA